MYYMSYQSRFLGTIIKQCKSDNIQIGFTLGESVAGSCP